MTQHSSERSAPPGARHWTRETDGKEAALEVHRRQEGRAVRPRDAATLILIRGAARAPEVLMGRRQAGLRFMPNKYVFPGGRVDPGDTRLMPALPLRPEVERRLLHGATPARARALALAAIRETFEETGIAVAEPAAAGRTIEGWPEPWKPFAAAGLVPALAALDFIARAITPPQAQRRFDARFFLADADRLPATRTPLGPVSGELESVQWVALSEAPKLDLPSVTRAVLDALQHRLARDDAAQAPVPFFHVRHGRHIVDLL